VIPEFTRKTRLLTVLSILLSLSLHSGSTASSDLSYYFDNGEEFEECVATPSSILGYEVGERHVSHAELVYYLRALSSTSDRVHYEEYGRSYGKRPMVMLAISAPENIANLETIKADRQRALDVNFNSPNTPLIVWMGYNIHGNEASAGNAALLAAYYLAASKDPSLQDILKETVILIDACMNPDGFDRYASWVNSHQSKNLISDPFDIEHFEYFPGARSNQYWFDMNRDWLPLVHPESYSRIIKFHEWKPNVLTDHHEMQTDFSFFFQPGIPSRNHPLTPQVNYDLTYKLTSYHAREFDRQGNLYFTKERFDDFYYGKGSTYPDINGCIGILFEQAATRGKVQESEHGLLTFPFTIKNQLTASIVTVRASHEMRQDLIKYQKDSYRTALQEAKAENFEAYIVSEKSGSSKLDHFTDILLKHQIKVYRPLQDVRVGNVSHSRSTSIIVPINQLQYRTIKAFFETRTQFQDSLFYDISAWNFPMAFNLNSDPISRTARLIGPEITEVTKKQGKMNGGRSNLAYLFKWDDYFASKVLYQLMEKDIQVKVATKEFTTKDGQSFDPGTIIIPMVSNLSKYSSGQIHGILEEIAGTNPIDFYSVSSGYSMYGGDLGSTTHLKLDKLNIIMPVGRGISSTEAGEVWHLLDQRMDIKITRVPVERFDQVDLNRYNMMVLVNGNYGQLSGSLSKIRSWIQAGGNVIAFKDAARWLSENELSKVKFKTIKPDTGVVQLPYSEMMQKRDAQLIRGTIFNAQVDLSHPIAFGLKDKNIPVFKDNAMFMLPSGNPYANPVMHNVDPLLSGYVSKENLERIKNTSVVTVSSFGRGKIVSFAINPNFRGFWWGTNQLFFNSLFFSQIIDSSSAR
jgi:hypothetical protein